MGSCVKSKPAAKITKTVTLPPLTTGTPSTMGNKGKKSGNRTGEKTKKKKKESPIQPLSGEVNEMSKIDCPAAVNKILTQKISQHQTEADSPATGLLSSTGVSGRRDKEAEFLKKVHELAKEERANQLRWYTVYVVIMYALFTILSLYHIYVG